MGLERRLYRIFQGRKPPLALLGRRSAAKKTALGLKEIGLRIRNPYRRIQLP